MKLFINILIILSAIGIAISTFFLLKQIFARIFARAPNIQAQINRNLKKNLKYAPKQRYLAKLGIMYRLKDYELTPGRYTILKLIASFITIGIGVLLFGNSLIVIIISAIFGYFVLDWYFKLKNRSDNKDIQKDINRIYIILNISLNSNIYIVDALLKCAEACRCKRLKQELIILSQNLSQKSIISDDAIQTFQNHFSSNVIRSFCNLLNSYYTYGNTDKYSKDLVNSIANSAKAQGLKDQQDMENKGQALTMAFFIDIIFAVVYVALCQLQMAGQIF